MVVRLILMFALVSGGLLTTQVIADNHGTLRMYKLNNKKQLLKVRWLKGVGEEGCHGSKRAREVHKFSQIGYHYCTLYKEADCAPGSELTAKWGGKKYRVADIDVDEPQVKLLKGSEWFLHESENVELKSWDCRYH